MKKHCFVAFYLLFFAFCFSKFPPNKPPCLSQQERNISRWDYRNARFRNVLRFQNVCSERHAVCLSAASCIYGGALLDRLFLTTLFGKRSGTLPRLGRTAPRHICLCAYLLQDGYCYMPSCHRRGHIAPLGELH